MATASRNRSMLGCWALPFVENDKKATRASVCRKMRAFAAQYGAGLHEVGLLPHPRYPIPIAEGRWVVYSTKGQAETGAA